jgi:hypothetical protein
MVVTPCRAPASPPVASPRPGVPPPAHSPESAAGLAADCAEQVRRGLETFREHRIFNPDAVRRHLESLRLAAVEVAPAPGAAAGVVFGGRIGGYCVYGEHSSMRTVVDHGWPTASGGCLRAR